MKAIPELELEIPEMLRLAYPRIYCGCHGRTGHFFFFPGMNQIIVHNSSPSLLKLDTGFAPQDTYAEGEAWYHSGRSGDTRYNVISFWDNSVDSRPGSHSTFLILGDRSFNDALAECRKAFPEVFARFKFEIKLRRNMFV
jgi:hypothetical protein